MDQDGRVTRQGQVGKEWSWAVPVMRLHGGNGRKEEPGNGVGAGLVLGGSELGVMRFCPG